MRVMLFLATFAAGCDSATVIPRPGDAVPPPRPELATAHDPADCGSVSGRVTFVGPIPEVPPLLGALPDGDGYAWVNKPNPFTPRISQSGGLANVLVWLDGIDPAKSKPWPSSGVSLEIRNAEFQADGKPFVAGVARTGDTLTATSRDQAFHSLRARGAAFFALPFPAPNSRVQHDLPRPGIVELSCATTAYWLAADVYVSNTPYAAVTNDEGHYTFDVVPAGVYTLYFRARNWKVIRTERDPESGLHSRQYYARPSEKSRFITIMPHHASHQSVTVSPADFLDTE